VQDFTGTNLLVVSCGYCPPNVRVANGVGTPVGSAGPPGVYWFAMKRRGPDLASSQTVPVALCASKGTTTPRGEQASRRQSSAEPRKRIKWSNSLDQDLLKCAGKGPNP